MKKVLVIGGSYFIGRVYNILADRTGEYEITVLNRGRYTLKGEHFAAQLKADRHDGSALENALDGKQFDTVVDFCAYDPGDCASLLDVVGGSATQYILISSCSVFRPSDDQHDEEFPLIDQQPQDAVQAYAYNKMLLEKEAKESCRKQGVDCTILRPSFVYGPFNYAPRESWYFKKLLAGEPIPVPVDATSRFQIVYVKDIAKAIMACTADEKSYNNSYNLAAPEMIDYKKWMDFIDSLGVPFSTQEVSVEQVYNENIEVPFPLDQNELYSGEKITRELGVVYTPFDQGMQETFENYQRSFG